MSITPERVVEALRGVDEPQLARSVVELGMVQRVLVDGGRVDVLVALPTPDDGVRAELAQQVGRAVGALEGVEEVGVDFSPMDEKQRASVATALGGVSEDDVIPFADPASPTRVLLVASGKGGVGKSSVTVNLAVSLAQRGRSVSIVDADVWGFSIPAMLGIDRPPTVLGEGLVVPPRAHGVACASIGFFVRDDQPVIWRGPMLHKALQQFLTDFAWGRPDYLVVDLPPGTGDIALSLANFLPRAEAYVVTTPQPAAQRVAQRAGLMFQSERIGIPVMGVVENMSWFTGDDGQRYELFGSGGGEALAERLGVPLLGRVPLVPDLRQGGDVGRPIVASEPDGEASRAFAAVARAVDEDLAPTKRRHPELRIV